MYKITEKVALNPTVTKMVIEAPLIAKKAKPGQFIIVRPFEDSERIPLTVAGYDREAGTVDIIFQIVGGTTMELNSLKVGESVHDFVGPLGLAHTKKTAIQSRFYFHSIRFCSIGTFLSFICINTYAATVAFSALINIFSTELSLSPSINPRFMIPINALSSPI